MQLEVLKNHEGLLIWGGTEDFRLYNELIHDVNERSPIVFDKEGLFLALAYDFRKAYEGHRFIRKPKSGDHLETGLVGFEILWPTLLVQCRMLRVALAFIDSSKRHQALAFLLEAVVEEGIPLDFPAQRDAVLSAYRRLDPAHPYMEASASSRIEHWYHWTKKERQKRIIELLDSLNPMFDFDYEHRDKRSKAGLMSPADWASTEEPLTEPPKTAPRYSH